MAISDIYAQHPFVPGEGSQQQVQGAFQSLPGLAQQKFQMDQQQAEAARQGQPVSPWQEAVMDLMQEHISPQEAAAKLKAKLGGGGMPQQQGLSGVTGMEQPQIAGGAMPQIPQAGPPQSPYAGMTQREFPQFMGAMKDIGGVKQQNAQRDYIKELELKNRGALDVQVERGKTAEKVAAGRLDIAREKLSSQELAAELNRRVKSKELDETIAHHIADEEIARDKLRESISQFKSAKSSKEKTEALKAMLQFAASGKQAIARVKASDMGLVSLGNRDVSKKMEDDEKDMEAIATFALSQLGMSEEGATTETAEGSQQSFSGVPQGEPSTPAPNGAPPLPTAIPVQEPPASMAVPGAGPLPAPQLRPGFSKLPPRAPTAAPQAGPSPSGFKVGERVMYRGMERTITKLGPTGKPTAFDPPVK